MRRRRPAPPGRAPAHERLCSGGTDRRPRGRGQPLGGGLQRQGRSRGGSGRGSGRARRDLRQPHDRPARGRPRLLGTADGDAEGNLRADRRRHDRLALMPRLSRRRQLIALEGSLQRRLDRCEILASDRPRRGRAGTYGHVGEGGQHDPRTTSRRKQAASAKPTKPNLPRRLAGERR
jgi:hypothetical protein